MQPALGSHTIAWASVPHVDLYRSALKDVHDNDFLKAPLPPPPASQAAPVSMFGDDLDALPGVLRLGRATRRTIHLNIIAAVSTKVFPHLPRCYPKTVRPAGPRTVLKRSACPVVAAFKRGVSTINERANDVRCERYGTMRWEILSLHFSSWQQLQAACSLRLARRLLGFELLLQHNYKVMLINILDWKFPLVKIPTPVKSVDL